MVLGNCRSAHSVNKFTMNPMMNLNVLAFIVAITHSYEVHDVRNSISGGNYGASTKFGSSKPSPNTIDLEKRKANFPYTKLLAKPVIYLPYVYPIEKLRRITPKSVTTTPKPLPAKKPITTKKSMTTRQPILKNSDKFDDIYKKIEKLMGEDFGMKTIGTGDRVFSGRENLLDLNRNFKDVLLKKV